MTASAGGIASRCQRNVVAGQPITYEITPCYGPV
jgi:hypothetical protein